MTRQFELPGSDDIQAKVAEVRARQDAFWQEMITQARAENVEAFGGDELGMRLMGVYGRELVSNPKIYERYSTLEGKLKDKPGEPVLLITDWKEREPGCYGMGATPRYSGNVALVLGKSDGSGINISGGTDSSSTLHIGVEKSVLIDKKPHTDHKPLERLQEIPMVLRTRDWDVVSEGEIAGIGQHDYGLVEPGSGLYAYPHSYNRGFGVEVAVGLDEINDWRVRRDKLSHTSTLPLLREGFTRLGLNKLPQPLSDADRNFLEAQK